MSASGLTAADPVTATSCVAAAAAVALLEDETDRDPQVILEYLGSSLLTVC